jgi:drug/metabolite transporter (DMT)-like permease
MSYVGYVAGFAAMVCFSSLPVVIKKVTGYGLDGPHLILVNALTLAALAILIITAFYQADFQAIRKMTTATWLWVGIYSVINFAALTCFIWSVKLISPTEYQIMFLASPLVVALLGFMLLSEPLQLKHLVGGIVVAAGILITIKDNF